MDIHKLGYIGMFGGPLGFVLGQFVHEQYYLLCLLSLFSIFFIYPKKSK